LTGSTGDTRLYTIQEGNTEQRDALATRLWGLDKLSEPTRALVVTAWVTSWLSGPNAALEKFLFHTKIPQYQLLDHVNETARFGLTFGSALTSEWGYQLDEEALLCMCLLHDVDKAMIYCWRDEKPALSELAGTLPHGVLGALLLHDLGFSDLVVSATALHTNQSPYHNQSLEGRVLHYADLFAAENADFVGGVQQHYQGRVDLSPRSFA
jgi:hypothetical protein